MKSKIQLKAEQLEMLQALVILPKGTKVPLQDSSLVMTVDVQYHDGWGHVGMDVLQWGDQTNQVFVAKVQVEEDYVPGFFAFREGPVVVQAINQLIRSQGLTPTLLIIDGHGTAHPRRMGLASWIGIKMNLPTIGIAKDPLLRIEYQLEEATGSTFDLHWEGEQVGTVLRTRTGVKPVFVSAGHQMSQSQAVEIIKSLIGAYRNIEPIRRADQAARQYAAGQTHGLLALD